MVAAQIQGLTKHYGHGRRGPLRGSVVRALEDLSIDVREGEIFGFLGPNGAGKSTLIRLLLGFLHPTAGSATVLDLDIVTQTVEIRRRVGYLPGGIALYDGLSGEGLLDYLARLYGRPAPLRPELVDRLELSERTLRRPVRDYSRGMRQKIGIIQALQHDPELAILDEPTEGLDPLMQRVFYDILDERRALGRTIFFSSHVLSEVERVCDRVAFVRRGHLVALQEVGALLAHRRRNVEMRLYGPAPDLTDVAGVSDLAVRDGLLTCHLEGDVGPFLAAIAGAPIADLTIEPAHLEEAFLELYAEDEIDDDEEEEGAATVRPRTPEPAPMTAAIVADSMPVGPGEAASDGDDLVVAEPPVVAIVAATTATTAAEPTPLATAAEPPAATAAAAPATPAVVAAAAPPAEAARAPAAVQPASAPPVERPQPASLPVTPPPTAAPVAASPAPVEANPAPAAPPPAAAPPSAATPSSPPAAPPPAAATRPPAATPPTAAKPSPTRHVTPATRPSIKRASKRR